MALDFTEIWKKLRVRLFFPEEKRAVFWVLVGPILLLFSSIVLLSSFAPLKSLILTLGVVLLITSYFAPERIAQIYLGLIIIFSLYSLKNQSSLISLTELIWTLQFILALYVAQQSIFHTKGFVLSSARLKKGLEEDNDLWRTRFDTLREKMTNDRQVWESEIELAKSEVEEKIAYAQSLRNLVQTAHSQIRMLEDQEPKIQEFDQTPLIAEVRQNLVQTIDAMMLLKEKDEMIEQLEALLSEARLKLNEFQNVYESRHSRNQELLTTSRNKPITLQSLARKRK